MLMALQFQGFKQGETLGFSAQETGGPLFRSRLNKGRFASLDYSQRGTSIDLSQLFIPSSRPFDPYPLSGKRSQGEVEGKITTRIDSWGSDGFARRFQCHSSQKGGGRFRIYAPCMIPHFFFRELHRAGYDLIKTIILKLKYYKTRQDAEFKKNTFKEDQKCH